MKINIKGILEFYLKGIIITFAMYTILLGIDMMNNGVLVSGFWKGFIVAYTWWVYTVIYRKIQARRKMERMISNMEELVRKFENGELTEQEVIEKITDEDGDE